MKARASNTLDLRQRYLANKGYLSPMWANEEYRQAGFYIETMELFIQKSEQEEVERLNADAQRLREEDRDEFWQYNYPEHWEQVFGTRIRSSFCAQLCSQVESILSSVTARVKVLARCPLSVKDLKGGAMLEQHRKYLEVVGGFNRSAEMWNEIGHLFRLRNIFVHEEGYAGQEKDGSLIIFLQKMPNIKLRSLHIELQAGACPALLEIAKRFTDEVFSEYAKLVLRLQNLENEPAA